MSNARKILSPMSGRALPLDQTPDEVFSSRALGDGLAILPSDGKIVSPVTGKVTMVADSLHAYGFTDAHGTEVLVHAGLDSVRLSGEGFTCFVRPGQSVRAGDPVAEVDLALLREKNVSPITPVLVCGGAEGFSMETAQGELEAGRTALITLKRSAPRRPRLRFDFFQKLGKVLMTVIAVMPAAGLMLSLGKLLQMAGPDLAFAASVGGVMENIGWAVIGNLHLLFAAAIGGAWAKDRAGGAFAAVLAFILINRITGAVFGVTEAMLGQPDAAVKSLFGMEMPVSAYFTSILGAPALNTGVFVGILSGFLGGEVYNRYYNFRRLPSALAFFNGRRFVPMAVMLYSAILSLILAAVWPLVQAGINAFGVWIAGSAQTSPVLAPFVYGTLERLLLPFGLHHMLTIPMNYTSFGGTYVIQTGVNAGTQVFGQDPLWLAWVTDLIGLKSAGNAAGYSRLMAAVTPGRFKVGQMIGSSGLLMGVALAMYRRVEPTHRRRYRSIYASAALAVFLTGVTEPLEFMFMFCAPGLYVVYSLLQGCAFALAGLVNLRLHAFGFIEFVTRIPMSLRAGLGGDVINFLFWCAAFLILGFFAAYRMIGRLRCATPGRMGNYADGGQDAPVQSIPDSGEAAQIVALLGGRENIELVDACMTRLRVTVVDPGKVADAQRWKDAGALGLVIRDRGVQAVYGPRADVLRSDVSDLLSQNP